MAIAGRLILNQGTIPDTPDTGKIAVYSKDDDKLYYKTDDGVEHEVTASGIAATTFLDLSDTPSSYDDGKYARSTAAGLEWATVSGAGGTSDHALLSNLDYASAAHTGFASTAALTSTSGVLQTQITTNATNIGNNTTLIGVTSGTLQTEIDNMTTTHSGLTDMPSSVNADHDGRYFTEDELGSKTTGYTSGGDLIGYPSLSGATYDTVGEVLDLINSTGRITGGEITQNGVLTVSVAAGKGFIKATDSDTAEIIAFDWAASPTLSVTSGTVNYVGVKYNSGTPIVETRVVDNYDLDTEFILGKVISEGSNLYILDTPWWVTDGLTNILERFQAQGHLVRDEHIAGLILSVPGTRNVAVTGGRLWSLLNEYDITAVDTAVSGTFELYWKDLSGDWHDSDVTQYPVGQWNDLTQNTLQNLTNNYYANFWVYAEADHDEITLVYPQAEYLKSAEAEAEGGPTSIPVHLSENGKLVGRILFREGVDAPVEVSSAWSTVFSATLATDHGNLAGLAGDDHSQYALLGGRSGGQVLKGGSANNEDLTFWTNSTGVVGTYYFTDLFTNGFVKTSGATGALSVDTTEYLPTTASGALQTNIDLKADISNVLELDNSDAFTPDADYEPATKKYVDDNVFSSPLTTKGDIHTWTSTDARLAVGTNDYILTADSAEATGLKWAVAPDGLDLTPAPDDLEASGFTATMTVDANGTGVGAALHLDTDGNWIEADANAVETMPVGALALETGTGSKSVLLQGFIRDDSWAWTVGAIIYVSETTGALTETAPTTAGAYVQAVGFATHADRMMFNPSYVMGLVTT